jgi:hypothetical protein
VLDSIYSDQHYWDSFLGLESATKTKVVIRSMDLFRYHAGGGSRLDRGTARRNQG